MILLIDNYDSFTYNLYHILLQRKVEVEIVRNDAISCQDVFAKMPSAIVISPGPCRPEQSGICLDLIGAIALNPIPLLGVCLGQQVIAQFFGARIVHAPKIMHGKVSTITHCEDPLFYGIPTSFQATRYHSLVVDTLTLPSCLLATAESSDDAQIMALRHKNLPLFGVQFHPESIASPDGPTLIANFLKLHDLAPLNEPTH